MKNSDNKLIWFNFLCSFSEVFSLCTIKTSFGSNRFNECFSPSAQQDLQKFAVMEIT